MLHSNIENILADTLHIPYSVWFGLKFQHLLSIPVFVTVSSNFFSIYSMEEVTAENIHQQDKL